ncbi:MAG TPA: DUF4832 domain-containing protein [Verrucomicrobiae bacterium]|nr:DUF4832 domain-containing protein [Verrucomicrobiae bacterium]
MFESLTGNACRLWIPVLTFLFVGALNAYPEADTKRIVVRPEDTGEALVNPGMGWTLHFYSNLIENYGSKLEPSDTLDDWPGLSVIYLRVPWSFLEPKEGEFNWSLFDTPAQRWIARGKQIAIRVSCCESWLRDATPKWVQEAGAKGIEFEEGKGAMAGGSLWEPDYQDPVFLAKLENFLAALARRYDGNPNVAFIDVGSFGMWGEAHTVFSSKLSEAKTLEIVRQHIDLHTKYFKKTLLAISDDAAGATKPGFHLPATDYALSRGVTIRDDSILVSMKVPWYHADLAQAFWPKLPVILEHEHFHGIKARNKWNGDTLLAAVEAYHASYMSIHGWPREVLNEWREPINRINRRLGYRIQLQEISWPAEVKLGEPFTVETTWANTGVAPLYAGGFWSFTLRDEKGGLASAHVDESFDFRQLKPATTNESFAQKLKSNFTVALGFPSLKVNHTPPTRPGTYDVFVSLGDRDGTPRIALPLAGHDGQRRYRVGQIKLTARK